MAAMEVLTSAWEASNPLHILAIISCLLALALGTYYLLYVFGAPEIKGKSARELGGGSLPPNQFADNFKSYTTFFEQPKHIDKPSQVPHLVDTFYNLVTDIYEWGWGQSFHFAPAIPGMSYRQQTAIHEQRVADRLLLKPGDRVLDAGCGVGGPMREIAAYSAANVVGITINNYQVSRALAHNKKAGLDTLCEVVCGDFLRMPFVDNSFDGAYAIEATCHAPKLHDVYAEIYRVLKPGKFYVALEWVTTQKYRSENKQHVDIIHGIEVGNALPGLRSYKDIVEVAREVGFEVLAERDLALPPALPWWKRLKVGKLSYYRNHVIVMIASLLGLTPDGFVDVHKLMMQTAEDLVMGGETGIFTPMHMLVCRKSALV